MKRSLFNGRVVLIFSVLVCILALVKTPCVAETVKLRLAHHFAPKDTWSISTDEFAKRVEEHHGVPFSYDDDVIDVIAARCTDVDSGGRMIDSILTNTVLPRISEEILTRMMAGSPIERVHVGVKDGEFDYAY